MAFRTCAKCGKEVSNHLKGCPFCEDAERRASGITDQNLIAAGEVPNKVTVVDIQMPFASMVIFLVKLAVAAVPAIILVALFWAVLGIVFGSALVGAGKHWI